jgi:UDP-N-acetylmuramate: L-alanyl-gamma-D-glutamyl-meso-diaminopimelate ligase
VSIPRNPDVNYVPYTPHDHENQHGKTYLVTKKDELIPVEVFGEHNMSNISAAREVCKQIGIKSSAFYEAIRSFKGAARRLEYLGGNGHTVVFKDFAHAPSKLKATTEALKKQFPDRKLVACLELHTFSSLNQDFLPQYKNTFDAADEPIVYINPHTMAHKKLPMLQQEEVARAFGNEKVKVYADSAELQQYLTSQNWENKNLLLMTSGNFNNLDLKKLTDTIV